MKLTQSLCKQHIKRYFKQFWISQGARKVTNTNLDKILAEKSIPICQPEEILNEKRETFNVEVIGRRPKPVKFDRTHPNWHDRTLLTYKDNNVLLEGLQQAKILTNTVEIHDGLPDRIVLKSSNKEINRKVEDVILRSHLFDAEQQKLPKIKDPQRPAFNFPRVYGITQQRIIKLLVANLLNLIETHHVDLAKERYLFNDLLFSYIFERNNDLIQFELRSDTLLTSTKPLQQITEDNGNSHELPDITPISPIITLNPVNIYKINNIYPINLNLKKSHPHTLIFNHLETEVKNLYEEEVTEEQIYGRSLLKTFTVAATYAKHKFGDIKVLPKPVIVQCIQTDGRLFHFGVLQLNTLDLQSNDVRNIWYQTKNIPLFDCCEYRMGRPVLEGYNSEVIQNLEAFYNNV